MRLMCLALLSVTISFLAPGVHAAESKAQQEKEVKTPADTSVGEVTKFVEMGISGSYKFTGKCPELDIEKAGARVTPDDVERIVKEGSAKIRNNTPLNDPGGSAKQLSNVLDAAISLACQTGEPSKLKAAVKDKVPARWVKVLGAGKFAKSEVLAQALSDYGLYLQKDGSNKEAVAPLEESVKLNKDDENSHLYLADSLWMLKKKDQARKEYRAYEEVMNLKFGPHKPRPPYVAERLSGK